MQNDSIWIMKKPVGFEIHDGIKVYQPCDLLRPLGLFQPQPNLSRASAKQVALEAGWACATMDHATGIMEVEAANLVSARYALRWLVDQHRVTNFVVVTLPGVPGTPSALDGEEIDVFLTRGFLSKQHRALFNERMAAASVAPAMAL